MINEIKDILSLIENPIVATVLVIIALGFTFYKYFQTIKRDNFTLHKERSDLVEKFIKSLSSDVHNDRLLTEELFQSLWGSTKIRYDEILFLMGLNSPKYFVLLYVKAKGFVEIENKEIKVQKKYNRHLTGLIKEENKIKRSYYFFATIFSIVLSTSMFINRPETIPDLLIIIIFLCICMIGMLFALLEVSKIYAAQKIIDEWKINL